MSEKDTKLLWGRSGNRCAICKAELSLDSTTTQATLIGEMAHIVGRRKDGDKSPRSKSPLTEDDRDRYSNLILLCRNDHKIIDDDPLKYPIEILHQIKSDHEIWVQEKLANYSDLNKQAANMAYTHLIDSAITLLKLETWNLWADFAGNHYPRWKDDIPDNIIEFDRRVRAACWPTEKHKILNLELALQNLAKISVICWRTFSKYCTADSDGWIKADKFYKYPYPNPSYKEQLKEYEDWEEELYEKFVEFCRAINWFSDEIRRNINPMFFIERGKFMFANKVFEYTPEEIEKKNAEHKAKVKT